MKKYFFLLSAALLCFFASSCTDGGCSIEGTWIVSDVKVKSSKPNESIVSLMESEYKRTTYQFNGDGTMSIINSNGTPNPGKYTLDNEGNTLKWVDDQTSTESVLKINNCSNTSFNLTQRMPSDPSLAEAFLVTMTIIPGQ